MISIIDIGENEIPASRYGGKAAGLSLLIQNGFRVPKCIAIEAVDNTESFSDEFWNDLKKKISVFECNGSYDVAVRSSATNEDSFSESMAGAYTSVIGIMDFDNIKSAIKDVVDAFYSGEETNNRIGIVIQDRLSPDYSGALMSSDPINYKKAEMNFSLIKGMGETLVSGLESGKDYFVRIAEDGSYSDVPCELEAEIVREMLDGAKRLEKELSYPVDVEWAVQDGYLYFLQCRPLAAVTGILSRRYSSGDITDKLPDNILPIARTRLLEKLKEYGVLFPDTYFYVENAAGEGTAEIYLPEGSERSRGFSVVMLYPEKDHSSQSCSLIGNQKKVFGEVANCCRYGVRAFPEHQNFRSCVDFYLKKAFKKSWVCALMVQETWDPYYTGVIKHIKDGFLIEMIRGSMVTKGEVPVTQYVVNREGEICFKDEIHQDSWHTVLEGHIIYCICNNEDHTLVSLRESEIRQLLSFFLPLMDEFGSAIEFGILKKDFDDTAVPYFMDLVEKEHPDEINTEQIETGILSRGNVQGKMIRVTDENMSEICVKGAKIFFCNRPDVRLLSLLEKERKNKIGFVFERASVNCHLAAVLRERKIPAITMKKEFLEDNDLIGKECVLDTQTPGLSRLERLRAV